MSDSGQTTVKAGRMPLWSSSKGQTLLLARGRGVHRGRSLQDWLAQLDYWRARQSCSLSATNTLLIPSCGLANVSILLVGVPSSRWLPTILTITVTAQLRIASTLHPSSQESTIIYKAGTTVLSQNHHGTV